MLVSEGNSPRAIAVSNLLFDRNYEKYKDHIRINSAHVYQKVFEYEFGWYLINWLAKVREIGSARVYETNEINRNRAKFDSRVR